MLDYAVTSNPNPLQASASTGGAPSSLTIVASNNGTELVTCSRITFMLRVGENAKDLTADASGIATVPPAGWNFRNVGGGVFTATPQTPAAGQIGAAGLAFTLNKITVNGQPGTSVLTVTEVAAETGTVNIDVAKFPPQFVVDNLTADPLEIGPGGSTTLSWSGSTGATYVIQYNGIIVSQTKDVPPQPLPAVGSYEIDNLQADTVFNLVVTLAVAGQDKPLMAQVARQVTVVRAQINQFTVVPLTMGMGAKGTVNWTTNADSCTLDPGSQSVAAPSGTMQMTFNQSQNLTLTATKGGDVAQESRSVTVVPPVIHSFTASTLGPVDSGTAVTLSWSTQFAASVTIDQGVGPVAASGTMTVNPVNTTTYTLTTTGLGPDVTQSITVAINSVQVTNLAVSPGTIDPGGSATLSWSAIRATSAAIDNGVGAVNPVSGSVVVTPNPQSDTGYTLTCEGPNGPAKAWVTLVVNSVKITSFQMASTGGNAVTMTWTTQNATAVLISKTNYDSPQNLPVDLNGSFSEFVDMSNPTEFVLTAFGAGASPVTASVVGSGGW